MKKSDAFRKQTVWLIYSFLVFSYPAIADMPEDVKRHNNNSIRVLLTPVIETVLSSQIAAKIKRLKVESGDSFKKGDHLLIFDCSIQKALLNKARAEWTAVEKTHQANLRLQKYNSISDLEVAVSEANLNKALAEVEVEQARIAMCIIKAPFSGRVAKRNVHPYESVSQGQPLLEILDDSNLELELYIPSSWLNWVEKGVKFNVKIDETGLSYPAKIISLGAKVDPVSHSISVKAVIDGEYKKLLSGMSGVALFDKIK